MKKKIPLYQATKRIGANYIFRDPEEVVTTYVAGQNMHARLYAAEAGYRSKYNEMYAITAQKALQGSNLATAALSVLYTDVPSHEGTVGDELLVSSFDLKFQPDEKIISHTHNVMKFFSVPEFHPTVVHNKGIRDKLFNEHLKERIKLWSASGLDFQIKYSKETMTSTTALEQAINKANFHELFHHSEQTIMEGLYDKKHGHINIAKNLADINGAERIYGFVLDIHSTRALCENCNIALIGMQSDLKGFLNPLAKTIGSSETRLETRQKGLFWHTRISCQSTLSYATPDSYDCFTIDVDLNRAAILQGNVASLALDSVIKEEGLSLDNYAGDFYASKGSKSIGKTGFEQNVLNKRKALTACTKG